MDVAAVAADVERDRRDARVLRTLVDQLPAMVAYWDVDCRNVVANHAYIEWFGIGPEQLRGMHISDLLGAEVYAKNLPFITGALGGEEQLFDRTLVDQSGRTRHTQASYVPDVVDGVVRGFFVLVTDVTPRVEAQRAMDEAQSLAKLGSWVYDVATDAVTWSRGLVELVGLDPASARPLPLPARSVHIHPDDRELVMSNIDRAVRTGRPYTTSYRIITIDGTERDVVSKGNPVIGPAGRVVRINGTMQDVTEANAAARDLARVNDELRRANELNADVLAMLGHDIRSPMSAVSGYLDVLDLDWDSFSETDRRNYVVRARSASARLMGMVERILALAAVDSGRIDTRGEALDLGDELEQVARESALPGLPTIEIDSTAPATVTFDRIHLQQIIGNLLTNAFRYGAEPVHVTASGRDGRTVITVSDAGAGVPADVVDSLFVRFARTGPRQVAAGGTGFGLYMSAQLAEANGATLIYRAADDQSHHAFVLTIPVETPPPIPTTDAPID